MIDVVVGCVIGWRGRLGPAQDAVVAGFQDRLVGAPEKGVFAEFINQPGPLEFAAYRWLQAADEQQPTRFALFVRQVLGGRASDSAIALGIGFTVLAKLTILEYSHVRHQRQPSKIQRTWSRMLQTFKADLFKALGHPVRIRILELLRTGEQAVSELQAQLAIDASSVSQQLAVLRNRQLIIGRKQGTSVYYRAVDEQVFELLDIARMMFDRHLLALRAMADDDDASRLDASDARLPEVGYPGDYE